MAAAFRAALKAARRRLPPSEEERVREAVRAVARSPRGDHALPPRVCATLTTTYESLTRDGRLGFLSLLTREMGADRGEVERRSAALASLPTARSTASRLHAQWALSPASLLERVMAYERVHSYAGWDDMKRRLHGGGRIYTLMHPAMGNDPLVFVHVALRRRARLSLDLGGQLHPSADFVSPREQRALSSLREDANSAGVPLPLLFNPDAPVPSSLRPSLLRLCALYLLLAKKRQRALDPVAAFHLRNGAILAELRWNANPSLRGRRESSGMM
ncbi:MAG: hypothetical protein SGPRY_002936, partial [Prymnesium sp.]